MRALETELNFFEAQRAELLRNHEGKFALIRGERLIGVYDTPEAAFEVGAGLSGEPMLIKRIEREERPDRVPALLCGWPNA